jgi:hypothetical protein
MPKAINRSIRNEFLLGAALVAAGLVMSSAALSVMLREHHTQLAQATSTQSAPSTNVDQKNSKDGVGPKELAPEPARPSEGTTGSNPSTAPAQKQDALPPAPPEKIGEPVAPK